MTNDWHSSWSGRASPSRPASAVARALSCRGRAGATRPACPPTPPPCRTPAEGCVTAWGFLSLHHHPQRRPVSETPLSADLPRRPPTHAAHHRPSRKVQPPRADRRHPHSADAAPESCTGGHERVRASRVGLNLLQGCRVDLTLTSRSVCGEVHGQHGITCCPIVRG